MGISITLPFTLVNGTTADASQVMADFNAITAAMATSAAQSGANSDITSLNGLTTPINPSQGGTLVFAGGLTGGSANALTCNTVPGGFSLLQGFAILVTSSFVNTGPTTISVNGSVPQNILKDSPTSGLVALAGQELITGNTYMLVHDGVEFVLVNPSVQTGGFGPAVPVTVSAGTADLSQVFTHNAQVGAGTITSFGVPASGQWPLWLVYFPVGATILNGVNLLCPGGVGYVLAAGSTVLAHYNGAGQWQILGITGPNPQFKTVESFGTIFGGTSVPVTAGGNINNALLLSNTQIGVYVGSGVPTISASAGSIYLRTDGSSTTTRAYINTNNSTGWTSITTAT